MHIFCCLGCHASMHIPYYCTDIHKIRGMDGKYRRAIDGGCAKQCHRFSEDTLVVTAMNGHGDIVSDPILTFFNDCYEPNMNKYYKMRDNGYKMMMKWDGKYKWSEYDKWTKSKYRLRGKGTKVMKWRDFAVFIMWCFRIMEEVKLRRILMIVLMIFMYKKYGKLVWKTMIKLR